MFRKMLSEMSNDQRVIFFLRLSEIYKTLFAVVDVVIRVVVTWHEESSATTSLIVSLVCYLCTPEQFN